MIAVDRTHGESINRFPPPWACPERNREGGKGFFACLHRCVLMFDSFDGGAWLCKGWRSERLELLNPSNHLLPVCAFVRSSVSLVVGREPFVAGRRRRWDCSIQKHHPSSFSELLSVSIDSRLNSFGLVLLHLSLPVKSPHWRSRKRRARASFPHLCSPKLSASPTYNPQAVASCFSRGPLEQTVCFFRKHRSHMVAIVC